MATTTRGGVVTDVSRLTARVKALEAGLGVLGTEVDAVVPGGGGGGGTTTVDLPWINVRDAIYGATGNGLSDDSAGIQAAINACSSLGGGIVLVPAGTYKINTALSIPNFVSVFGVGQSSILRAGGNNYIFNFNPANRARISNIQVDAASAQSSGGGFDYTNAQYNIWLDNIWVGNNLFTTFNMKPSTANVGNYFIDRVRINGVIGHTTVFAIGDGTNIVQDIEISNISGTAGTTSGVVTWMKVKNAVDDLCVSDTLFYQGTNGIVIGENATNTVSDGKFKTVRVDTITNIGINIAKCRGFDFFDTMAQASGSSTMAGINIGDNANGAQFFGGTVQTNVGDGIAIVNGAVNTKIIGVKVSDNNTGNGTNQGISVAANTTDFTISNCLIGNNLLLASGHQKYGVFLAAGSSNRFWITQNRFSGNESGVINNGATGFQTIIKDNYPDQALPAVASAATVTLPAGAPPIVQITGTTNVTSVTAGMASQEVTLVFTGILTFTDGSNLKLAGNFVTTADDTITLFCDGTNWFEKGRSVN